MAGQNPLAHVAAIGDPDTLGQARSKRNIDAYGGELYPLERPTLIAHQPRELRRKGGIVNVEDIRADERIGQGFEETPAGKLRLPHCGWRARTGRCELS